MLVITGAAGFIGSCLVRKLNDEGLTDLVLVDKFSNPDKDWNLEGKAFLEKIERDDFPTWFTNHANDVEFVFHLGARTDTTEQDTAVFDELNLHYSKQIWRICTRHQIPLVYASSAATYGMGEHGYADRHDIVEHLEPLNPYGVSKNDFDKWVLDITDNAIPDKQRTAPHAPPLWAGLKFFNVYGPNEYHKGRMASVVFHTINQINSSGTMKLFRSHREDVADGQQKRDFIYVKDVVEVCYFFYRNQHKSGLYNVGTGTARTFLDLATLTFRALDLEPAIEFIDTPEDIRATYQYFTEADIEKLQEAGFDRKFYTLEEGVEDYVRNYLKSRLIW